METTKRNKEPMGVSRTNSQITRTYAYHTYRKCGVSTIQSVRLTAGLFVVTVLLIALIWGWWLMENVTCTGIT